MLNFESYKNSSILLQIEASKYIIWPYSFVIYPNLELSLTLLYSILYYITFNFKKINFKLLYLFGYKLRPPLEPKFYFTSVLICVKIAWLIVK